jgi:hypothetical protein
MKLGRFSKVALAAILTTGWGVGPSLAMNWEGHDDWMAELPQAIELQAANPETPAPPDGYEDCRPGLLDNPYEQIPLTIRKCRTVPLTIEN